ncbi:MAG: beta strand repeat-containing protein [Candidatus Methylumidiphilus sp.]
MADVFLVANPLAVAGVIPATFTLNENSPAAMPVGTVTANGAAPIRFAITAGNASPDGDGQPAFAIDAATGQITVNDGGDLDFEATPSFNLAVQATDAGGLAESATINIQVSNVNEQPTGLSLSAGQVNENVVANSVIGTLSSTDPDAGNTFSYSLVAGDGAADNSAFSIVGDQLKINAPPDFESQAAYLIRVRGTDQGGLSFEKALTVSVNDLREAGDPPIVRVSTSSTGAQSGTADDWGNPPALSANGRYVAFSTVALGLVPEVGYTNRSQQHLYLKDVQTGATRLVSANADGVPSTIRMEGSFLPSISANGRYVVFVSDSTNLVPETSNVPDYRFHLYWKDMQTGAIQRVGTDAGGALGNGTSWNSGAALSADGRYVALWSNSSDLVDGDDNGCGDIFLKDMQTGAIQRISTDAGGAEANDKSDYRAALAGDGRYVAFASSASNLVPGDSNAADDIFLKDTQTGAIQRVSTGTDNAETNADSGSPAVSVDGRYVAFASSASNLVPEDSNAAADIFLKDTQTGALQRVSTGTGNAQANAGSGFPAISADGRYVVFSSSASNLVPGDTNNVDDIFLKDMQTGAIRRISVNAFGGQRDDGWRITSPALSADGLVAAFGSDYSKLVPGDTNGGSDTFIVYLDLPYINSAPTGLRLSTDRVDENVAAGSVVGTLSSSDPDAGDAFTYSLVAGDGAADNAAFSIAGDQLKVNAAPDFESQAAYHIRVRTTDQGGLSFEKALMVSVNDLPTNSVNGTAAAETFAATDETDTIRAEAGNDTVTAAMPNWNDGDTFDGQGGVDTFVLTGGTANQVLTLNLGDSNQFVSLGNSTLNNATLNHFEDIDLSGFAGRGVVTGDGADNRLVGGDSGNALDGGAGADYLVGGDGDDTYVVDSNGDTVVEGSAAGNDTVRSSISHTLGGSLENLVLTGAADLRGVGNALGNHLTGNAGDNRLTGGLGDDTFGGGGGADTLVEAGDTDFTLADGHLSGLGNDTFSGIASANLSGGAGGNTLDASGFTGTMTVLQGGGGDDRLVGGGATDWAWARGDADFALTDTRLTGLGTDTLSNIDCAALIGGAGGNRLDASAFTGSLVILEGGGGDDTLVGRAGGIDRVKAQGDADFTLTDTRLTGLGADTLADIDQAQLVGGAGGNRLDASAFTGSLVILEGGGGDDTLIGRVGGIDCAKAQGDTDFTLTDTGLTGQGADTLADIDQAHLVGGAGGNRLDASAFTRGRVLLQGGAGDDVLRGGAGDDSLSGGLGDDVLFGGGGIDRAEARGDGDFTLTATQLLGLGADTLDGIEEAYLCGGSGDNILDASGFTGSLVIFEGQGGNDTLIGRADGIDRARAVADADFVLTDTRLAGLGEDTLTDIDQAELVGNAADNVFDASAFTRGRVILSGDGGGDTLRGGSGADTLNGGAGADSMVGGGGNDYYYVDNAGDQITETAAGGRDTVFVTAATQYALADYIECLRFLADGAAGCVGNAQDNLFYAGAGDNRIDGGGGVDTVTYLCATAAVTASLATAAQATGGSGSDTLLNIENLTGSGYADTLGGDGGRNVLVGGLGADVLVGGLGADTFRLYAMAESGPGEAERDAIADFSLAEGDKIDLSAIDADALAAGNQRFASFIQGGAFSGAFASAGHLYFDQAAHVLYGNTDADGTAEFSIELIGVNSLGIEAFVL